jgi:hypothetical protein
MGTISHYGTLTNGVPPSTTYLTSNDGYLHVWNYGPEALFANYTSAASPSAPTDGIPVPAGKWVILPADTSGAGQRLAFGVTVDSYPGGGTGWQGMHIWVT